jgi:hypothetical protein
MKTQKTISKILATVALSAAAVLPSFGQLDLGAACGCPPVGSRGTPVNMSSLPGFNATTGELDNGAVLNCATIYVLDQKIYVPSGQSITIPPGTLIKGKFDASPANATALVIERGAKIYAVGTPDCPIVFTAAADPMNNTYPVANKGQWGGIVILGKAVNNLTLAANGPFQPGVGDGKLAVADGIGTMEGFATSNSKDQFGGTDDNDNSGILKYVSIRFAGAILQVGGELNALSLGSVGRGTTIDHVDIVSCADDAIEAWGGTVNIKYASMVFGNDDIFDYDDGYRGKAQFLFGLKTDNTASVDADNGFEMDSDDQKSNNTPRSHPVIYNVTMIGNNKTVQSSDNSAIAAINAKELTEGELYNSVFANFKYGLNIVKALGTRTGASEAYHNWATTGGNGSSSLKIKCNTFVNFTSLSGATDVMVDIAVDKNPSLVSATDRTQFTTTDLNVTAATVAGFNPLFAINNNTSVVGTPADATPNPALSITGCPVPPADGFFSPAPYRGAFAPNGKSWLADWTYNAVLGSVQGAKPCPTDISGDGSTTGADLNLLLQQFGQQCK